MNDHQKRNPRLRQTVIVAVCVLAVLLFLYLLLRDRPGSASDYLDDSAPYTFDSSASRTFRTVDSRLAVVSSSGLQLLDENGKTVLHEIFTLSQPGISVGGERVCAYDIGGTTLCVADFKGSKTDIEPAGEIISADLSDSGYLAVCSDAAGYKGAVTVYDTSGKAVYVWYSGTGYLVRAAVSPDGKYLAVLCLQDSGSVVHTFALTSADERGSAACADELFADLFWRGGKALLGIFLCGVGVRGDPVLAREAGVVIRQFRRDRVELALKVPAGKRLRHRQEPVRKQAREQRRAVERDDDGGQLRGAEDQPAAVAAPNGGQKNGGKHHCQYDLHRCIPVLSL